MFDPIDPTQQYFDPMPQNMTEEELEQYWRISLRFLFRCFLIFLALLLLTFITSLFSSCSSTKDTSIVEQHHIQDLMQHIDSLVTTHSVIRQDSAWRETILRQFKSIREKSDTSHHVVVDTAGRVIKETLVINNVREVTSDTDRRELQVMTHRLEAMDSTINIMRQQLSHSDSLLQQRQDTVIKEVEKDLSWWQQLQVWIGRFVLIALAVLAALWILKKKLPWLPF